MKFIFNIILSLSILILSIPTIAENESISINNNSKTTVSNQSYLGAADQSSNEHSSIKENENIPSLVKSADYSGSLDFCGSRIPIHIHDVRERLEKEMLLILWDRAQIILWIKRASQYFPHIDRILKEYGLPLDLKYVAVIESGLRAQAGSSKGAMGTWQFMLGTAQDYDLRLDDNIDARKNLIESTRAASEYFRKLYARFRSWPLALAAYNMGENGLAKEMALQEVYDYYRLYLPQETQRYVLRVIAAREIMENPAKYGFYFSKEDYYPVLNFDKVTVNCSIRVPIALIAKAAKSYFKEIKDLNPDIRGYYLDRGQYTIFIPPGMSKIFYQEFERELSRYQAGNYTQASESSNSQITSSSKTSSSKQNINSNKKYHIVKSGDSLTGIAQEYGISFERLLKLNNFNRKSVIHPGQKLIVR